MIDKDKHLKMHPEKKYKIVILDETGNPIFQSKIEKVLINVDNITENVELSGYQRAISWSKGWDLTLTGYCPNEDEAECCLEAFKVVK